MGVAQSHSETTTLRSTPVGRGGPSFGYAPAAMRSVQSAKALRSTPIRMKVPLMPPPLGPDRTRRSHASRLDLNVPRLAGISRVALSPIWWQFMQFVFTVSVNFSPGASSNESQYAAGYTCAAVFGSGA